MDTYSTNTLLGVVDGLKVARPAILQRYFPAVKTFETEVIVFDKISKVRRLAPFVHPKMPGRIVKNAGFTTDTFKPAYVKDKREFDPSQAVQRAPGEALGGGTLSMQQRRDIHVANAMADQIDMANRRFEVMAVELLRLGTETVVGEGYPETVVDFQRHASLSPVALAGGDAWTHADSSPLANLRTWMLLTLQRSGVGARDVILGTDAAAAFCDHADVKGKLDNRHIIGNEMNSSANFEEGLTSLGTIDGFNIFSYAGWYYDEATDAEVEIFPANEAVLASPGLEGVQAFGAIKDATALTAVPFYPKMWIDDDPGLEWLLMQSAPLMVPQRIDATLKVAVVA